MKKIASFAIAVLTIFVTACSSDEEKETLSGNDGLVTGVENEFGDARFLIGEWTCSVNKPGWTFKSDGTCIMHGNYDEQGVWSYNPETRYLATTVRDWSWTVNLLTANNWQGSTSAHSYGYTRVEGYIDENRNIIKGRWRNEKKAVTLTVGTSNYKMETSSGTIEGGFNMDLAKRKLTLSNIGAMDIKTFSGATLIVGSTDTDLQLNYGGTYIYVE